MQSGQYSAHPNKGSHVILNEILFIWVKKPIPKEDLQKIYGLAVQGKKSGFKITLLVDKESNFFKTAEKIEFRNDHLKIKMVEELLVEAKADDLFNEEKGGLSFLEFNAVLETEMHGFSNPAAYADYLRVLYLYLHGGYYFDTDIQFGFVPTQKLVADSTKHGLLLTLRALESYFKPEQQKPTTEISGGNNDILAATSRHPFFRLFLENMMREYKVMRETLAKQFAPKPGIRACGFHPTLWDAKRQPQQLGLKGERKGDRENRLMLTLRATGPSLLIDTANEFMKENNINDLREIIFAREDEAVTAMGIHVQSFTDSRWLTKEEYRDYKSDYILLCSALRLLSQESPDPVHIVSSSIDETLANLDAAEKVRNFKARLFDEPIQFDRLSIAEINNKFLNERDKKYINLLDNLFNLLFSINIIKCGMIRPEYDVKVNPGTALIKQAAYLKTLKPEDGLLYDYYRLLNLCYHALRSRGKFPALIDSHEASLVIGEYLLNPTGVNQEVVLPRHYDSVEEEASMRLSRS